MRHAKLVLLAALVFVLAVPLAGCGKIAEKAAESAVEKATGVKVDEDGGKVTFEGKDGSTAEFSTEDGQYPEDFPSDFPKYDDAKIDGSLKSAENGKAVFTVTLKTPDTAVEVYDWYLKELQDGGWTVETQVNATTQSDAYGMITVTKGDQRGTVTVNRGADDTESSMLIGINPVE